MRRNRNDTMAKTIMTLHNQQQLVQFKRFYVPGKREDLTTTPEEGTLHFSGQVSAYACCVMQDRGWNQFCT